MNFSFLGALASLLPGYVQGERQAIADNWQDLMNYNRAQQGQLANAFTEATWQNRLNMMADADQRSGFNVYNDAMNVGEHMALFPSTMYRNFMESYYAPQFTNMDMAMRQRAYQLMMQNPGAMLGGMAGASKPTILGGYYGGHI